MARKPRDYRAEYARRIAKGQAEGRSRAASRGHTSNQVENARARARRQAKRGKPALQQIQELWGGALDWGDLSVRLAETETPAWIEDQLRRAYVNGVAWQGGYPEPGRERWDWFNQHKSYLPEQAFWYHPGRR